MVGLEAVQQRSSSNICSKSMLLSASPKNSPRPIPGLFKSMSVTQSNFSTPSEALLPVRKETVSTENKPNEKELWKQIPLTQGEDRADTYVQLSHLAYDRGDHTASLALCQSAREIYEGLTTYVATKQLLHVYEGITWSLRRLERDAEAAQVALEAVKLVNEDDPAAATEMFRDAGRFFYDAKEFQKSLDCHQKALKDVDPDLSDITIGVDYFNCGSSLQGLEKYEESIPYLLTSRMHFKKAKEPERVYLTDSYLTTAYIETGNSVEAIHFAQKALDFAVTAQNQYYETWSRFRMGCAKVLIGEFEAAEEELRVSLSMNSSGCNQDWDLAFDAESEIANIYSTQGKDDEAVEINRRLANLKEIIGGENDTK